MKEPLGATDCHAYVDDGLNAEQRNQFELALRADPHLRRRVETWQAQNEAIRRTFGGPARTRVMPALSWPVNENAVRVAEKAPERPKSKASPASPRNPDRAMNPVPPRGRRRRVVTVALLAALFVCAGVGNIPRDPRDPLMDAGKAAIRAFATPSSAPLDFASGDIRAVRAWLAPRFVGAPLAELWASPSGWRLVGARIVPGVASPAALILYEDGGRPRAGVMIEPFDAPPPLPALARESAGGATVAARTEAGYGIAAMGPDVQTVRALMAPALLAPFFTSPGRRSD